jgi:hypothetical protein
MFINIVDLVKNSLLGQILKNQSQTPRALGLAAVS